MKVLPSAAAVSLCILGAACSDLTDTTTAPDAAVAPIATARVPVSYGMAWLDGLAAAAFPAAVNDRGTVVGSSYEDPAGSRAFVWRRGVAEGLPGLGGPSTGAEDINNAGVIVGHADDADGRPHAVVWRKGRIEDLGTLGGTFSFATGVNDRGQVVGASETATGDVHAFLWSGRGMVDLGVLPGETFSRAEDVNNRGTVVGWSAGGPLLQRATVWKAGGGPTDLGTLGYESGAVAINDRGHIAGGSIPDGAFSAVAVIWDARGIRSLGTLNGDYSTANDIDDSERVVGVSLEADGAQVGVVWDRGAVESLGRSGAPLSNAAAVNNAGSMIVGFAAGPVEWFRARGHTDPSTITGRHAPAARIRLPVRAPAARPSWANELCATRGPIGFRTLAVEVMAGC